MTGFSVDQLTVKTRDGLNFTLAEGFTFTRPNGETVTVPAGATSDGASVPRAMWLTLPPFGSYWMAAFTHDYLYRESPRTKDECDTIFKEAMDFLQVGHVDEFALYQGVSRMGELSFDEDRAIKEAAITNQPIKEKNMFAKIASFFASFFHNAKTDPVNTAKGIVQLAAAGGVAYAMSTGGITPVEGVSLASTLAVSGLHAIGTNTTTQQVTPAAQQVIDTIVAANTVAPQALDLVAQVKQMRDEADTAQGKVLAYSQLAAALASALPAPEAPPLPAEVPTALPAAPIQ